MLPFELPHRPCIVLTSDDCNIQIVFSLKTILKIEYTNFNAMATFRFHKNRRDHLILNLCRRAHSVVSTVLFIGFYIFSWNTCHCTYAGDKTFTVEKSVLEKTTFIDNTNLVSLKVPKYEARFATTESTDIKDCSKQTACSCLSSTLGMVDLSPLADSVKPR